MGILYTAQYGYSGDDRVDISRQGCKKLLMQSLAAPGEILAPSDAILWPALAALRRADDDAEKQMIFEEYVRRYRLEMRRSYRDRMREWQELIWREMLTLVCFCTDARFCHRIPAAQYLARAAGGALDYQGERR